MGKDTHCMCNHSAFIRLQDDELQDDLITQSNFQQNFHNAYVLYERLVLLALSHPK